MHQLEMHPRQVHALHPAADFARLGIIRKHIGAIIMQIIRCPSCEGYGWHTDEFTGEATDCAWCSGVGYVYQNADGVQHPIPPDDYGAVSDQLEALEQDRMRELGYQGEAKPPWEQAIRKGTRGGLHPSERDDASYE